MLTLMLITNDPDWAAAASQSGVQRIFVDLERVGKHARQGHLNTVISNHSYEDIVTVKRAAPQSEILVRLNPEHVDSHLEIEKAIEAGADLIMLPMFTNIISVQRFTRAINKRCRFVPLVETLAAIDILPNIVAEDGVDEIYVGLNDLHLERQQNFMFEPLADGTIDQVSEICRQANKPFGFGGVGRMDDGLLKGHLVLAEHIRLGSSSVIISRSFLGAGDHRLSTSEFSSEIQKLRAREVMLSHRTAEQAELDSSDLKKTVADISQQLKQGRP